MDDRIILKLLQDVGDPREIFDLIMAYADKTKKNSWKCLGEALNPERYTVVIYELDESGDYYTSIGYANIYITNDNDLFFHHGYLDHSIVESKDTLEQICLLVQEEHPEKLNKVIIHSEVSPLWKRYGFQESKMRILTREFPPTQRR